MVFRPKPLFCVTSAGSPVVMAEQERLAVTAMTNFGGMVPLKVQTSWDSASGSPDGTYKAEARSDQYRVEVRGHGGVVDRVGLRLGLRHLTEICARDHRNPGAPRWVRLDDLHWTVSPVCPLTKAGSRGCCVWLAWASVSGSDRHLVGVTGAITFKPRHRCAEGALQM